METIKAKDIHDCDDCPLYKDDCSGGWTSGCGGTPIEPPCCSWDDEDEIYVGMYNYDDSEYPSEYDLIREKEHQRKQQEEIEKRESEEKERLKRLVYSKTSMESQKLNIMAVLLIVGSVINVIGGCIHPMSQDMMGLLKQLVHDAAKPWFIVVNWKRNKLPIH